MRFYWYYLFDEKMNIYKVLPIVLFNLTSIICHSQDYISFRNYLNEGTYWFYEQNYDSATYYYAQAEQFNLKFFPEEAHLYSRSLWEIGDKEKSILQLKNGGLSDFFKNDTTFYLGMTSKERTNILDKLPSSEDVFISKSTAFYDKLEESDQKYRSEIVKLKDRSGPVFDSLVKLMKFQDSVNFDNFILEIENNGYPGGYTYSITPHLIMLHADPVLLLKYYKFFYSEILAGRMNLHDFAQAYDRCLTTPENQNHKPYNAYSPLDSTQIDSPEMVFINRCSIGMSPYYDGMIPIILLRRGKTPSTRSKLYDYYKIRKENFNCTQIR